MRQTWPREVVRVLIVCDGTIDYLLGSDFSLSIMLSRAFEDVHHPDHPDWARFKFTKAHRGTAGGTTPGFENFRFTRESLNAVDELWLFGELATYAPAMALTSTELRATRTFMNRGGGVLAMGDHEDLGLALCGQIPRVRSMRAWWFKNPPPPPGMPEAPTMFGLTQNDTLAGVAEREDDSAPQRIFPVYRYTHLGGARFAFPHPILCGPRGPITCTKAPASSLISSSASSAMSRSGSRRPTAKGECAAAGCWARCSAPRWSS